eukprot:scaffold547_cov384-Prasinococcus_capsulatus_cf.AAC.34
MSSTVLGLAVDSASAPEDGVAVASSQSSGSSLDLRCARPLSLEQAASIAALFLLGKCLSREGGIAATIELMYQPRRVARCSGCSPASNLCDLVRVNTAEGVPNVVCGTAMCRIGNSHVPCALRLAERATLRSQERARSGEGDSTGSAGRDDSAAAAAARSCAAVRGAEQLSGDTLASIGELIIAVGAALVGGQPVKCATAGRSSPVRRVLRELRRARARICMYVCCTDSRAARPSSFETPPPPGPTASLERRAPGGGESLH